MLSTGPGNAGGAGTSLDGYGGTNEFDVVTLSTSFTVAVAPLTISFAFAFATSEHDQAAQFDDLFDITLQREATPATTGVPLVRGSVLKGVAGNSPWRDYGPYDGVQYIVNGGGSIQNTLLRGGRTAWAQVCLTIDLPGNYTLQFRVADQGDATFDSALLVDAVQVPSPCALAANGAQLTTTSGAVTEWKGGSLTWTPVESREVALADNPPVLVFVSSANLTGDNPGAQEQVFAHDGFAYQRLTAASSGRFSKPAVSANGRWVAFASTANLTGQNSDGNWEIFRVDRQTLTTVQVTNTLSCQNSAPSIADDATGNAVAFITTCSLPGLPNPDGNPELAFWNGTNFTGTSTAGCQNYAPSLARQQTRYVAFVSTCNFTGSNSDGNPEIFRWDRQTSSFQQLTNTTTAVANDTPSIDRTGTRVVFVSNGNFSGSNADGSYEVFLWQSPSTFTQISNEPATVAYVSTRSDDAGVWAVGERLDLTTGAFAARVFYTPSPGSGLSLFTAFDPLLPAISASGDMRRVALSSSSNPYGNNPDGNPEVFHFQGSGGSFRVACAQPNAAIPDNNTTGVTSSLVVSSAGTLADLNLWVQISHTRVSDLEVRLTSPAATTQLLVDRPGIPTPGSCNGDNVDAVLDDEGTQAAETQCLNLPALSGSLIPNNPLSAFDGQAVAGTWQLNVRDRAGGQTGTLQRWCLIWQLN
jgi:subtilisin-like proprotein convertase family protein